MTLTRILKHLIAPQWLARRAFPPEAMRTIQAAVANAEQRHVGELRFAVEAGLPIEQLWHGLSARDRAVEVFSRLRVWDTQHNSGVLVYVQLVDRRVEIVADRGISAVVDQSSWDAICRGMESAFRDKVYLRGALEAVERIGEILATNFPASPATERGAGNELPDQPVML